MREEYLTSALPADQNLSACPLDFNHTLSSTDLWGEGFMQVFLNVHNVYTGHALRGHSDRCNTSGHTTYFTMPHFPPHWPQDAPMGQCGDPSDVRFG